MGYLSVIEPSNKQVRQKMLDFMEQNLVTAKDLFPDEIDENHDVTSDGILTEWVYGTENGEIGFYYHAGSQDICDKYSKTVLRWMAIKIGKKRVFEKHHDSLEAPYLIYDDHEFCPIYPNDVDVKIERLSYALQTDEFGFTDRFNFMNRTTGEFHEADSERGQEIYGKIQREVECLEEKWQAL